MSVLCLWKLGNIEQEPKNNETVGGRIHVKCVNDQVMCGMGIEGYTPTCGVAQWLCVY